MRRKWFSIIELLGVALLISSCQSSLNLPRTTTEKATPFITSTRAFITTVTHTQTFTPSLTSTPLFTYTLTPTPTQTLTVTPTFIPTSTPGLIANIPWPIAYASNYGGIRIHTPTKDTFIQWEKDNSIVYSYPSWSPDGKYISYSVGSVGLEENIHIVNLDTKQDTVIDLGSEAIWSPDGLELTYINKDGKIASFNLKTKTISPITHSPNKIILNPTWSWDGKWLAYITYIAASSDHPEIKLFNPLNNTTRTIHMNVTPGFSRLSWSPDGTKIVFRSIDRCGDLYTVDIENEQTKQITKTQGGEVDPAWSPDGQWIAFSATSDTTYCDLRIIKSTSVPWQLFVMRPDGRDVQPLVKPLPGEIITGAVWSPVTQLYLQSK